MISLAEIKKSFLVSLWFMFLTFPIMVIRVNTIDKQVEWRWENMLLVGIGSFFFSYIWRYLLRRKEMGRKKELAEEAGVRLTLWQRLHRRSPDSTCPALAVVRRLRRSHSPSSFPCTRPTS